MQTPMGVYAALYGIFSLNACNIRYMYVYWSTVLWLNVHQCLIANVLYQQMNRVIAKMLFGSCGVMVLVQQWIICLVLFVFL